MKEGQLLYQTDQAPFQAALDNALAALARAEANLPALRSRHSDLAPFWPKRPQASKIMTMLRQDSNGHRQKCNTGRQPVQSSRINLGYTRVSAPISGRIGKSNVTEGAIATA